MSKKYSCLIDEKGKLYFFDDAIILEEVEKDTFSNTAKKDSTAKKESYFNEAEFLERAKFCESSRDEDSYDYNEFFDNYDSNNKDDELIEKFKKTTFREELTKDRNRNKEEEKRKDKNKETKSSDAKPKEKPQERIYDISELNRLKVAELKKICMEKGHLPFEKTIRITKDQLIELILNNKKFVPPPPKPKALPSKHDRIVRQIDNEYRMRYNFCAMKSDDIKRLFIEMRELYPTQIESWSKNIALITETMYTLFDCIAHGLQHLKDHTVLSRSTRYFPITIAEIIITKLTGIVDVSSFIEFDKKDVSSNASNNNFSFPTKEHYKILDLKEGCTKEQLKIAWRQKLLQYHPDKNNSPEASEMTMKITAAYKILSDIIQ